MVPILLTLALFNSLHAMEEPSTSPQKKLPGTPVLAVQKSALLSTKALQESQTMQCWLEVLESGMPAHPKVLNPRQEFTQQLASIAGIRAVELINTYHTQKDCSAWYKTVELGDLLTLCSGLHYLESPLHEAEAFIYALGQKVLEKKQISREWDSPLVCAALKKIKKLENTPELKTFKQILKQNAITASRAQLQNEILAITHSRAYFYSPRDQRLLAISLSENASNKSLAIPEQERITALYCGSHEKIFAGTDTGKIFDLTESSPKLLAEFGTKKAVKKIYAPTTSRILALTANSIIWKIENNEGRFFEKEYENSITDCAFGDHGTKIVMLFSNDQETKLAHLTPYGYLLGEQLFTLKHARLSPDGKHLLGVSSQESEDGFFLKHITIRDGTEETFFIQDSYKATGHINKTTSEGILPWNGGIAGLPTLDLGFSNLGNFFYVMYGRGKARIFNVHTNAFQDLVQNHAPAIYIYETQEKLTAARPTPTSIAITTYETSSSSQSQALSQKNRLDSLFLYAAIRFAHSTEGGLALSISSHPALYKIFLTLPPEHQEACKKYFGVSS